MKRVYDDVLVYTGIRWLPIREVVHKPENLVCYDATKDDTTITKVEAVKESGDWHTEKVHHMTLSTGDVVDFLEEPYLLYVNHQTRERDEIPDENENSVRVFTFERNDFIMRSESRTRKVTNVATEDFTKRTYMVELPDHLYLLTKADEKSLPVFK